MTDKRKNNKLERAIGEAFRVHFDRVQIPIMDITKIYAETRKRCEQGQEDLNQVMLEISTRYK